jgi:ribosomal protein L7/L12
MAAVEPTIGCEAHTLKLYTETLDKRLQVRYNTHMETNTQVIERLVDRIERLSGALSETRAALDAALAENDTPKPSINVQDLAVALCMLARNHDYKIMAIKILRQVGGITLSQAKNMIDANWEAAK